jgi:hypothetical protein
VQWTHAVVERALDLHRARPFGFVISRSLPWAAHLAGYWSARALKVPWLANFNDPWDLRPFAADRARARTWKVDYFMKFWMRRTLRAAEFLTFPCSRLMTYCLGPNGRKRNVSVIPHVGMAAPMIPADNEDFLLVHAGKLGLSELTARPAGALLEGIAGLLRARPLARQRLRLVLVGPEDQETKLEAAKLGLTQHVTWVGEVSYERSLEYIGQASVCILIEGDFREGIFLPSKLCDYLVAGKPILALSPEVGTVNDLARQRGLCRVSSRPKKIAEALQWYFDLFVDGQLGLSSPEPSLVRQFEMKHVVTSLCNVLFN